MCCLMRGLLCRTRLGLAGLGSAMRALSHGEVDNPLGGQGSARLRGAGDTAAERAGKHVDELAIFGADEGVRLPRYTCDPTSHDAAASSAPCSHGRSPAIASQVSASCRRLSTTVPVLILINNSSSLDSGVDIAHPAKPACMLLASFVLILGLVAGLVAFEYSLLVEPLQWIARE